MKQLPRKTINLYNREDYLNHIAALIAQKEVKRVILDVSKRYRPRSAMTASFFAELNVFGVYGRIERRKIVGINKILTIFYLEGDYSMESRIEIETEHTLNVKKLCEHLEKMSFDEAIERNQECAKVYFKELRCLVRLLSTFKKKNFKCFSVDWIIKDIDQIIEYAKIGKKKLIIKEKKDEEMV